MGVLEAGSEFAGYRIEDVAGRGGMGVVYRARDLRLDRVVALKLIAPELAGDPGFRERFDLESRITASIDHDHVIQIYEADEFEDQLFLIMRYVEGTDLRALIQREGRLAPLRTARIVEQVASALDVAHERGLVHRDIKPANVLIAFRAGRDHVYLTDFGLTKDISAESGGRTRAGTWVGTLDYVAPEQLRGAQVDARADVYALGCLTYEALAGHVPYQGEAPEAKMFAHVYDEPPSLGGDLGRRFDPIVRRAMAKQPDDRYPSAGDFGRALTAVSGGDPISFPERSVATGRAAPALAPGPGAPAADQPYPVPAVGRPAGPYPPGPPGVPASPPTAGYPQQPPGGTWSSGPRGAPRPRRGELSGMALAAVIGAGVVLLATLIVVVIVAALK